MTGTDLCVNKPHKSRSYLNHLVYCQDKVKRCERKSHNPFEILFQDSPKESEENYEVQDSQSLGQA
jgi:hypothetical protein